MQLPQDSILSAGTEHFLNSTPVPFPYISENLCSIKEGTSLAQTTRSVWRRPRPSSRKGEAERRFRESIAVHPQSQANRAASPRN